MYEIKLIENNLLFRRLEKKIIFLTKRISGKPECEKLKMDSAVTIFLTYPYFDIEP